MDVTKRSCAIASLLACLVAVLVALWAPDPWDHERGSGKNACPMGYGTQRQERRRNANQAAVAFVRGNLWTGREEVRAKRPKRNEWGSDGGRNTDACEALSRTGLEGFPAS